MLILLPGEKPNCMLRVEGITFIHDFHDESMERALQTLGFKCREVRARARSPLYDPMRTLANASQNFSSKLSRLLERTTLRLSFCNIRTITLFD